MQKLIYKGSRSVLALASSAAAGAIVAGAAPALAQQQPPKSDAANPVSEVVVTATRRATNVQSVPLTITALSGAALRDNDITDLTKLPLEVPSLYVGGNDNFGSNSTTIRGIGSLALGVGAEEAVGVYIDGVYQGKPYGNVFDFVDIASIEVLEGPQGTLYGRNATGGAININTIKPSNDFTGQLNAQFTNYNGTNLSGYVILPLIDDKLSLKVAGGSDVRDGWAYDPTTNSHPYWVHNDYGSIALRWTPDALTEITFAARIGTTANGAMFKAADSTLPIDEFVDYYPTFAKNYFQADSITIKRDLGFADFYAISAYQFETATVSSDSGLVSQNTIDFNTFNHSTQFSQELRLVSKDAGRFSWLAGVQYYHENSEVYDPFQIVFANAGVLFDAKLLTNSYAGYVEGTYKLTDKLSLTAGGRYSEDYKHWDGCGNESIVLSQGISIADCAGPETTHQNASWGAFTPHFDIDYKATKDVMIYASATRGFRSGGWNYADATAAQQPFNPEYVWSYEGGIKSYWFNHDLRVNLTAFHADYTNLQVRANVGEFLSVYNAGAAAINGLELQSRLEPVKNLAIELNAAWLDARYTKYSYVTDGVVSDFTGESLSRSPKWDLTTSIQYGWDLNGWGTLTPRAEYHYVSQIYYLQPDVQPEGAMPINTVNLNMRYQPLHQPWNVSVFCQNATNDQFRTHTFDNPLGVVAASYSDPRLYGVRLQYNW